ncbi:MAG: type II secretion system protein [Planctomycetes bacterium]|nr:type II secretion system protein [Planctomycetota bacterium]MBM4058211.1 type II secretion system protein [Planctomycetota bacterium]
MSPHRSHRGFTLVELLVVASILAVLFSLVLSGMRRSKGSVKGAAQQFAAVLRQTQARALGNEVGASLMIEPDADGGITIAEGNLLPFMECTVTKMPPAAAAGTYPTSTELTLSVLNATTADLKFGYKLRYFAGGGTANSTQRRGPPISDWYAFRSTAPPAATVSFQAVSGQTSRNAYWPPVTGCGGCCAATPPPSTGLVACVARYPTRGSVAMRFPKAATVDLRYSGTGNAPSSTWGNLDAKGLLGIAFDQLGGLDALMQQVPASTTNTTPSANTPIDPSEPVFFFIVDRAERMKMDRKLATKSGFWVVIQPQTGQVDVAANVPQTGVDSAALTAARANARQSLDLGR